MRSPYPVHVHVVPWVKGHIGKARANGYAQGSQPFVTYVDDDDYVLPHAFSAMSKAIESGADAIFPDEQTWQNGQIRAGAKRHHLAIYRRSMLIDHAQWKVCGDLQQSVVAGKGHCIDLPEALYVHRLYLSGGRQLRRNHPEELRSVGK